MIDIDVIIKKHNTPSFIKMSMEEYVMFIKEQSKLLNIKEEPQMLVGLDLSSGKDISPDTFRPESTKEVMERFDETMKVMRRHKRSGNQC